MAYNIRAWKTYGSKVSNAGALQTEIVNQAQGKKHTDNTPCQFAAEKETSFRFGDNHEAHWPANHLQRGSETDPAKKSYRGSELRAVKERDNHGRKRQSGNHSRAGQQ